MSNAFRTIAVELPTGGPEVMQRIAGVFARKVRQRCSAKVSLGGSGELRVRIDLDPSAGGEGFRIEGAAGGGIRIVARGPRGALYGLGKLLRCSRFEKDGFAPGSWRGESSPLSPVRGIYFATHFHNFYHEAPLPAVQEYVEDLGLWGMNALLVWFDMHHFDGIDDPGAQAMIERLAAILRCAKEIGLDAGIGVLSNEAYRTSPPDLRANPHTGRAHYEVELCPSKPAARELLLQGFDGEFAAFQSHGVTLDYLWTWPYDQGGCACPQCAPWGCNGHLAMSRAIAELARRRSPALKLILSTWLFDFRKNEGEWEGLARAFEKRPDWVDYLLADSHTDWPKYLLEHPAPGGLPLVNFPEISMWHMWPWGGLGANPGANRFQRTWEQTGGTLSGGFPYSEGFFEDINKAIALRLYWDEQPAAETLREYAAFEFSPDVADDISRAAGILERNQRHCVFSKSHSRPLDNLEDAGSQEAWDLIRRADARLSPAARSNWRWRILYLRAFLDAERYAHRGLLTESCRPALEELARLCHVTDQTGDSVKPPLFAIMP